MSVQTLPRLDTAAIRQTVDIVAWIGRDVELHETKEGYYYGPCPFCEEGKDRFKVWPDTRLFNCRRCGRKGDVIEYQREKRGYDFVTAAKSLLADEVPQASGGQLSPRRGLQGDAQAEYRRRLGELAERSARCMAGAETPEAFTAWQWLESRGVGAEEILRYHIGYNTSWRQVVEGHKMPPGVTLPRYNSAGDVVAVNVYLDRAARELTGRKRMFVKGSDAKTFFGDLHDEAEIVLITEGELDCALLGGFCPPHALLAAVTTGGADTIPDNLGQLAGRRVVLMFDNDTAGQRGAERWRERLPGAVYAPVPQGKDVTEYWKLVGDPGVVSWVDDILRRVWHDTDR